MRVPARLLLIPTMFGAVGGYLLVVRGALTLDLGIGRRTRPLGPLTERIAAPPETVFDVIAAPYLGRTPRAMSDKLEVPADRGKRLVYRGQLETDLWALGRWWGQRVAVPWDRAVARSLDSIRSEAERRSR